MKKENKNVVINKNAFITSPLAGEDARRACEGVSKGFTARAVIPLSSLRSVSVRNIAGYSRRSAFTLIELLVVVLIIGILAAVAVPQYQKSVNKTRFSKLVAQVRTLARAMELVYLEKGEMPISFEELSIGLPFESIERLNGYTCGSYADGYCCITPFRKNYFDEKILCGTRDYSFAYVFDLTVGISSCIGKDDSIQSLNLCKHLTRQTNGQSYILVTPQGEKTGYSKFNFS